MSADSANEVLLRPAVELYTVAVCIACALLCIYAPWTVALSSYISVFMAGLFLLCGAIRLREAWVILRYRRNIRRLPSKNTMRYKVRFNALEVILQPRHLQPNRL